MTPVRLPADAELPLLRAKVGDLAPRALVVGDPARAAKVAGLLDDARRVGANREYVTYTGAYRGTPITVASHGVGSAGAAVCFEELSRGGVTRMIRSGTAGGIQPEVVDGSIVVATGAVRGEGLTAQLVPPSFPALAAPELVLALRRAAAESGLTTHSGIVLTSDVFYPGDVLGSDQRLWQRAGVVAVEMEVAALLVVAALHGVEAGAVLAIDGNPLAEHDDDMSGYAPHREIVTRAVDGALHAALSALVS